MGVAVHRGIAGRRGIGRRRFRGESARSRQGTGVAPQVLWPTQTRVTFDRGGGAFDARRTDSLFLEKFSLIHVWKFPVRLHREFRCKLLKQRGSLGTKIATEGRILQNSLLFSLLYLDSTKTREAVLTLGARWIRVWWMIRPGFLSAAERGALIVVARDGLVEHRVARRANAIVLLNDGWNCEEVGSALLLDDDTVREWFGVYQRQGMAGLRNFGHEGSSCQLTDEQQTALKAFVTMRLPRSTNAIGAWLRKNYELSYSHSGLIALLHRLGFVYHKPQRVPRKLDEAQQRAFIASYEKLLNRLEPDESVVFVDAVHPTHQARPAGCWAPKDVAIGIEQTTGRQRLNIHGAINLETGQTQMLEAPKIDAMSLIALLVAIEAAYSGKKWIHVFLDNATYHHATLVREWLGQPGRRIRLYFIPSYCPHLDPIERCWGVMHEHVTNNRSYETFAQFRSAILRFLRRTVTKKWDRFRDRITDNFRIISPDEFRVVA